MSFAEMRFAGFRCFDHAMEHLIDLETWAHMDAPEVMPAGSMKGMGGIGFMRRCSYPSITLRQDVDMASDLLGFPD